MWWRNCCDWFELILKTSHLRIVEIVKIGREAGRGDGRTPTLRWRAPVPVALWGSFNESLVAGSLFLLLVFLDPSWVRAVSTYSGSWNDSIEESSYHTLVQCVAQIDGIWAAQAPMITHKQESSSIFIFINIYSFWVKWHPDGDDRWIRKVTNQIVPRCRPRKLSLLPCKFLHSRHCRVLRNPWFSFLSYSFWD